MHPLLRWYTVAVIAWAMGGDVAATAADTPTAALQPIFNGRDLTGWRVSAGNCWRVEGHVLVGESDTAQTGSMLLTERAYGDVIVELEVRFREEIDSGIMLRQPEVQVQIGVSRSLKRDMTCSFYVGNYPEEAQAKRAGEFLKPGDWNRIRIRAQGDTFTVWLNGEPVSQYTSPKYADPAPIGLQIHGGLTMKVEFRDLRALPLE